MRYYNVDGTFQDFPRDTGFGWNLGDIIIDEASPILNENNECIRKASKQERSTCRIANNNLNESRISSSAKSVTSDLEKSPGSCSEDTYDKMEFTEPKPVTIIDNIQTDIKEEIPTRIAMHPRTVEGVKCQNCHFLKLVENFGIPSQEKMIALINPVNPESKALLSIVSYSKYKRLNQKEANEKVFKSINFKTTKSNQLIDGDSPFENENRKQNGCPHLNFLLTDKDAIDSDKQLACEIRDYHAAKEENMLSLMMELVMTDFDSNVGDMSELKNLVDDLDCTGAGVIDTSDLGTSIYSSIVSKDDNDCREKTDTRSYLDIHNRSSILSSIGLGGDIDKSIEYFQYEKTEMFRQITDIKRSFQDNGKKLDKLIAEASFLEHELRETAFLDKMIDLLEGKLENVKSKKLPFKIFQKSLSGEEEGKNLII